MSKVVTEHLPASSFAAPKGLVYEDVFQLHPLYEDLAFRANMILTGPKGVGKSLSIASYAAKLRIPLITFDCSEDVRRSHLLGMYVPKGKAVPFVLGPVPTAFEIANETGRAILLLEEINALSPQAQKLMNPIADFRRRIVVAEAQSVFELNPGAELWLVGTMNSSVYGGVYELNEDLKSRFNLVPLSYPITAHEENIVKSAFGTGRVKRTLISGVLRLAHETRQGQFSYALSTRDVMQILENIALIGLHKALWISTGKFEDEDRVAYKERLISIFSVDLDK